MLYPKSGPHLTGETLCLAPDAAGWNPAQHTSMPFTQTDLDALDAARKQGARRVRFQDREFEFDSVDDYLKLRNLILNDVAQQSGPQQVRQVRIYTTNGWGH
jgi:hypothetical protein